MTTLKDTILLIIFIVSKGVRNDYIIVLKELQPRTSILYMF